MKDHASLVRDAKAHLVQRRYDLAVETASEAIRAEPKQAMAYLVRAEALRKLGQPDRALADVAVAIRIDPDRASPWVIRAEILKKRCSFDQAIADATQAIFIDPDNAAAFSIRAECRLAIGDTDGAAHDAQEVFRIDPTRPPSTPASIPPAKGNPNNTDRDTKQAGGVARGRDDSVFADGNAVDRSLKARKAISSDDAAELLADGSGYKPEVIARSLPRVRSPRSRSGRPSSLIVPAIGICVLLGVVFLLAMRGQPVARTPKPAAEDGRRVVATDEIDPGRGEPEGNEKAPIRPAAGHRTGERGLEPSTLVPSIAGQKSQAEVYLYNGKDLTGWTAIRNGQRLTSGQVFQSNYGELVSDRSAGGYLRTDDSFQDFTLKLEYKFPVGGKISNSGSGVLLVGDEPGQSLFPGIECQVMPGQTGDLYAYPGSRIGGEPAPQGLEIIRRRENAERPIGEWNDYEIRCEGSKITLSLNGRVVNQGTSDRPISCRIGLMCQMSDIRYRNLRLRTNSTQPDASTPTEAVSPEPPLNATAFNGHRYMFFPDVVTWHGAKDRCEKMGGHLVTIGSGEENEFVLNLAKRGIERLGRFDGIWLGATDELKEGHWKWVDGSNSSYAKWDPGQPNNKNNDEHYLLLWLPKGLWCDQPDDSKQHVTYFVCEWDRVPRDDQSPPVGKWVELRPGTPGGDRERAFQPGGTLVFKMLKDGKTVTGSWRKQGERIYFSHPSMDANEAPTKDKWFTITDSSSKEMTILMEGQRQYVWYRSS